MQQEIKIDKKTLHRIVSLYAQGNSLREIGRQVGISHDTIKKTLKKLDLYRAGKSGIIHKGICESCHKTFIASSPVRKYCHDPCDCRYKSGAMQRGMNYFYIKIIRREFWNCLKANPEKALKLQQEMENEEGKEFRDMILGEITETDEFKHLKSIQNKYKKCFDKPSE